MASNRFKVVDVGVSPVNDVYTSLVVDNELQVILRMEWWFGTTIQKINAELERYRHGEPSIATVVERAYRPELYQKYLP
jgi:hypothetical protein